VETPLGVLKRWREKLNLGGSAEKPVLQLMPPLSEDELRRLEGQVPCSIPSDVAELLRYARGFRIQNRLLHGGKWHLSEVDLSGLDAQFGLEEVFPHGSCMADDGAGNEWIIDLTSDSKVWGPIFFACHDPPAVVFHTANLTHFMEEVLKGIESPETTEIYRMQGELTSQVWRENPGVLGFEECVDSADHDLRAFAQSLDASYEFVDLRKAKLGDGFSWGRYGSLTANRRFGEKRIFAYQKKTEKTRWQRLQEFWRG